MPIRLSKFIANSGIASRRKSEELIKSGKVIVNNIKILEPYIEILPDTDVVIVNGVKINQVKEFLYIALHKPVGYISDLSDPTGRNLARNLIKVEAKIFPVGRLDYNSEGLIIFTNDGEFANKIMHPKFNVEKEYHVKFKGRLDEDDFQKMRKGVFVDGSICKIKKINFLASSIKNNWYRIIISEGRNRIIRKIGNQIGHPVLKLKRVRIGNIKLGELQPGQYRFLNESEIRPLRIRSERFKEGD